MNCASKPPYKCELLSVAYITNFRIYKTIWPTKKTAMMFPSRIPVNEWKTARARSTGTMTMLLSPQILAVGNGILTPIETALANPSPGIIMEVDEIYQKTPTPNTKTLRTRLVSFKNYLQEGQYNHLKTAVKGTFTVFPKSPTFV